MKRDRCVYGGDGWAGDCWKDTGRTGAGAAGWRRRPKGMTAGKGRAGKEGVLPGPRCWTLDYR